MHIERSKTWRLSTWFLGKRTASIFFDLRVFDPNACWYFKKTLQQCHAINENEKKRAYNERVLPVDHGSFTPLIFSIYGSMGRECHKFYSRLSDLLSEKHNLPTSVVANWVIPKVCLALLKSSLFCLRGSRTVCRKTSELECDVGISHYLAKIW